MARTIQSPGVEIKEVDLSLRPALPVGTTVLIPGFSQNGPTDELIQVTSASEFEQIYGSPTTPVERYFYHTVRSALNSPANVFCTRMSYGPGGGTDEADKYSALVYPVFPKPDPAKIYEETGLANLLIAHNSAMGATKEIHTINWVASSATHPSLVTNQGTFELVGGAKGQTASSTGTIQFSATEAEIKAAIETLPGINQVTVQGDVASGQTKITYDSPAYQDVTDVTVQSSTLKHFTDGVETQVSVTITGTGTAKPATVGGIDVSDGTVSTTLSAADDINVLAAWIDGNIQDPTDPINNVKSTVTGGPTLGEGFTVTITSPVGPVTLNFNANGLTDEDNVAMTVTELNNLPGGAGGITPVATAPIDVATQANPIVYTQPSGDPSNFENVYNDPAACKIIAEYVRDHGYPLTKADVYYFGEPSNIDIDGTQYREFQENRIDFGDRAGHITEWKSFQDVQDKGGMGFILLNTKKLSVNEKFEGFYIGVGDNTNLNPASDFDGFIDVKGFNQSTFDKKGSSYIEVPQNRLNFSLSAAPTGLAGSVSEVMENVAPFDLASHQFSDVLSIGVFKVRPSTLNPDITKLDYVLSESYFGSYNFYAQQYLQEGGLPTSFYVQDETSEAKNFRVIVNPYISKNGGDWYDENKEVTKKVRMVSWKRPHHYGGDGSKGANDAVNAAYIDNTFLDDEEGAELFEWVQALNAIVDANGATTTTHMPGGYNLRHGNNLYAHGAFQVADGNSAETGNIPRKLSRVFEAAENLDLYPLDIICEAGLGTVYVGTHGGDSTEPTTQGRFDDEKYFDISYLYNTQVQSADDIMANYKTVANMFINFCGTLRKDCLAVLDNLRYIWVQGEMVRVLDDKRNKFFSKHIYWPLRHLFGTINSSYACTYGNWLMVQDPIINKQVWVPPSGFAAAAMANTDSNFQPWFAPAGFTRGLLTNINDVAFMPKQKHRDQMYKIGVNPIASFPNDGFVIFGQKTLQSKPSAFDRINVRRMFLYAERAVRQTIKYFVFEPNTLFTRQQVVNVLTPIFERIKQTQGLYDYMIVCDDRNNPPDVIDQNEMVVDIYLKPVRSAEFILVNFYATRTSQDFSELIA